MPFQRYKVELKRSCEKNVMTDLLKGRKVVRWTDMPRRWHIRPHMRHISGRISTQNFHALFQVMVFAKETVSLFSMMVVFGFFSTTVSGHTVYIVGDSAGWNGGNVDYHMWGSTKTFQLTLNPDIDDRPV
ncbi:hypothetical protein RND71_006954 [Anisodus tanguticus]|uniref:Phytocyanin domain-containing protein n=1 Tax=Anisodus tanguticus TaxID=243964 RepID=A0AAE1SW72_9SOLA|nr:hypothetical protein RND71_006954 [Anisodus tanguticus]